MTISLQTFVRAFLFCAIAGLSQLNLLGQDSTPADSAAATTMSREQIIAEGEKMADAQLAQLEGKKPDIEWVGAVMWAGYADFSHVSSQKTYADAISQLGESVQWKPTLRTKAPYHADDFTICQTFLDAYVTKNEPNRLASTQGRMDEASAALEAGGPTDASGPKDNQLTWWWCDALFMAPAGFARLSVITKDPKYVDAMDKEWGRTADLLYDKDEHLFFRDKTFLAKLTKNGKKIFWSRGNGWVFAGLARTLTYLPANYPARDRYVAIFKDMAAKLASLQQQDGAWHPSLLDSDEFPEPEMSGTALDCYAFAWGINNGLLDRATYLPVVTKAWAALLAAKRPDGLLGHVQDVGFAPAHVKAEGTKLYATGAFLMDVCELSKLAPITVPALPPLEIPAVETPTTPQ